MTNDGNSNTNADFAAGFTPGLKILNRYTLQRVLGRGGMGVVWLAKDDELDLDVALKFLPTIIVNDRTSLADLKRETRRSLELTHPNIVRTFDFFQDTTVAGISMEYVDSDTLRARKIDQPGGVFQPADLGEWSTQLADALDYAHQHVSIVHRDLKPANLLINTRNRLKVADFGISRSMVESVTQVSGANSISGTLAYMSPQQLDGEPTSTSDDIYSFGATLYELCTSRPPFYTGDISRQVHLKMPPSIAERRKDLGIPPGNIPAQWETTVASCLAKDPLQRPQSAGEVAARLGLRESAAIGATATILAPATVSNFTSPTSPTATSQVTTGTTDTTSGLGLLPVPIPVQRKAWLPLAAAAAVALLAVIGLGMWAFGSKSDKTKTVSNNTPAPAPSVASPIPVAPAAPLHGDLFVETDPPGARVKVDDQPAEKTPAAVKDLTTGTHTMKVVMEGYEDYSAPVEVKGNQVTAVGKVHLVRSMGWLNVTSTPAGADIAVTGPDAQPLTTRQAAPWNSDKLPAGDYVVTATRAGWPPVTKKVALLRDQSLPVAFDLTGGSVQISSVPPKANVLVAGKVVGTTPYVLQDVPPGSVQYSVAATGYVAMTLQGKVESGQPLNLSANLVKQAPVAHVTHQTHTRSRGDGDDDDNKSSGSSWDKAERATSMAERLHGLGFGPR